MNDRSIRTRCPGRASALVVLALASAALPACGAVDPGTEAAAENPPRAEPQQLDPDQSVWRKFTFDFNSDLHLATVYVFNQPLGSYQTGTEYWFVNKANVGKIGTRALTITATDESSTTAPPDPNYLSEQRFTLAENVSWGTGWTTDPVSGGSLYTGTDPERNFVGLRLFTSGTSVSHIVWYELADGSGGCTVCNLTPAGTFSVTTGAVTPPAGTYGYDISQNTF